MTSKQKKNLRKKLQRQRKKKEKFNSSQVESSVDLESKKSNEDITSVTEVNKEIDDIDINIDEKAAEDTPVMKSESKADSKTKLNSDLLNSDSKKDNSRKFVDPQQIEEMKEDFAQI